jgi:hypothetical protein
MKVPFFAAVAIVSSSLPVVRADVAIQHRAVSCVVAEQHPVFGAQLEPKDAVSRARVYFRTGADAPWYYVAMEAFEDGFRGVLPRPKKTLPGFTYYIDTIDAAMSAARTEEHPVRVVDGPGACRDEELAGLLPSASVVIGSDAGVATLPAGFSGTGVSFASAGSAAAGGAQGASGGGGGGIGTTALVIGGLAVVGAGVAVAAGGGGDDGGGDGAAAPPTTVCNRPRSFDYTAAFVCTGVVSCGGETTAQEVQTVTNTSCETLTIATRDFTSIFTCPGGAPSSATQTETLNREVAPGQSFQFVKPAGPGACGSLCCRPGPCGPEVCSVQGTWTVNTSHGSKSVSTSFTYPGGCPACATGPTAPGGTFLPGLVDPSGACWTPPRRF